MNGDVFVFNVNEELRKIRANTDQTKISTVSKISSNTIEVVKKDLLQEHDEISNISNISNISRISSSVVNPHHSEKNKVKEVKNLIVNYARYWGETEENIEEYIKEQLETYSLDDLINCFKSLSMDIGIL